MVKFAMGLIATSLVTGNMPCHSIDDWATAYMKRLHGTHLREVAAAGVAKFNAHEPVTDWPQVWLMDIEDGGGMIFAGHDNKACYTGVLQQRDWRRAVEDMEGGGT